MSDNNKNKKQLSEVSRDLIIRYMKGAIPSLEKNYRQVDRFTAGGGLKGRIPPHIEIASRKVATRSVGLQVAGAKLRGAKPGKTYANIRDTEGMDSLINKKTNEQVETLDEISGKLASRYLFKRALWHGTPTGVMNTMKSASSLAKNTLKHGSLEKGYRSSLKTSPASRKALKINHGMVRAQEIVAKKGSQMKEENDIVSIQEGEMSRIDALVREHLPKGHIIHGINIHHSTPNYIVVKTAHKKELKNVQYHHLMRNSKGEWEHKFITRHIREQSENDTVPLTEGAAQSILSKAFPKARVSSSTKYALSATAGFAGGAYAENAARKYLNRKKAAEYREKHKEAVKESYGLDEDQYGSLPEDILHEISVNTLASYSKKAVPEIAKHFQTPGSTSARKFLNRYQGVAKAKKVVMQKGGNFKAIPSPDEFRKLVPNYNEETNLEQTLAAKFKQITMNEGAGTALVVRTAKAAGKKIGLKKKITSHMARNSKKYAAGAAIAGGATAVHYRHESVDSSLRHGIARDVKHPSKVIKHALGKPARDVHKISRGALKAAAVTAAGVGGYMLGGAASQYLNMGDEIFKTRSAEILAEKAPPGAKYERMVMHIKGKNPSEEQKRIAFATAWKHYDKEHGRHNHTVKEGKEQILKQAAKLHKTLGKFQKRLHAHSKGMDKLTKGATKATIGGMAGLGAVGAYAGYKGGEAIHDKVTESFLKKITKRLKSKVDDPYYTHDEILKMRKKNRKDDPYYTEDELETIRKKNKKYDSYNEDLDLSESMNTEVYNKIAQYKKMGFKVTDVHVSENKASFVCTDRDGVSKKHVYESGKRRVENMGSSKPAVDDYDDDDDNDTPKKSKFKKKVKK